MRVIYIYGTMTNAVERDVCVYRRGERYTIGVIEEDRGGPPEIRKQAKIRRGFV